MATTIRRPMAARLPTDRLREPGAAAMLPAMPYIRVVPPDEADDHAAREYSTAQRRAGRVWNIVSIMSPNGVVMRDSMRLYMATMYADSPLARWQREMIAVVTSQVNDCHY